MCLYIKNYTHFNKRPYTKQELMTGENGSYNIAGELLLDTNAHNQIRRVSFKTYI